MATWTTIPDADLTSGKPGKQSIFRALRDNIDAALSGDPSAPKIQSGAFDDGVITGAKLSVTTVGNSTEAESMSLTEKSTTLASYTKVSEIYVGRNGDARIVFNLRTINASYIAYGKIYKNGIAVGTERTTTSTTYVTFSEDFTSLVVGDLIQLYIHTQTPGTAYTNSMKFNVSNPLLAAVRL